MELFNKIKKLFTGKKSMTETSFPKFKVDVPIPSCKPFNAQNAVIETTKSITTYQLVQELNRRKNNNHDGYEICFVIGENTGNIHIGNQSSYSKKSICHACGLGRKCLDKDCPNTKIDDSNRWMFPETVGYKPSDDIKPIIPTGESNATKN